MTYRYSLDRSSRKYTCPKCGRRTLVRYLDSGTTPLGDEVGRCDRINSCGYHLPPRQYFADHPELRRQIVNMPPTPPRRPLPPSYIPSEDVEKSVCRHGPNHLLEWICRAMQPLGVSRIDVFTIAAIYRVGTSGAFGGGSTTYWQIDTAGNVRTGKTMAYDPRTGCRIKEPCVRMRWAHSILRSRGLFNLRQCFFGSHLLASHASSTVLLLESEKAALIVAALLYARGQFGSVVPLATGGCSNIRADSQALADPYSAVAPLRGRRLIMAPDAGVYADWARKAELTRVRDNITQNKKRR